ncbi:MAG: Lpg1974 family pore-forming outer membrane protein [Simkaniaceae bacterium]
MFLPMLCFCNPRKNEVIAPAGRIDEYQEDAYCRLAPSAGPGVSCGWDAFVTADFIYWTARYDGLSYTASAFRSEYLDLNPKRGGVFHSNFGFDPGFKAGLGFLFDHDGWDLNLQYTWLFTREYFDQKTHPEFETSTFRPTWFDLSATPNLLPDEPPLTSAKSRYRFHFQSFDWELGRSFFLSPFLSIRPSVGMKGSWQELDFTIRYRQVESVDTIGQWRILFDQNFWGFGPRLGFQSSWYLSKHWSLSANFAAASLWSQFRVKRNDKQANIADPDTPSIRLMKTKNQFHIVKPVIEMLVGIRYETWFKSLRYHYSFEAGFEQQYWFQQNQLFSTFEESDHGDLQLMGLTLKLRFDF